MSMMSTESSKPSGSKHSLTRRNFLTAAAAAGGIAAVAGADAAAADEAADEGQAAALDSWRRYSWLEEPPTYDESQIAETVEAEIVVVGGGNAGLMCACAAAEEGATVAVVETQASDGIYYWGLHDIANVNSQYCLDRGVPQIDTAVYIAEHQRRSINRTDPRMVKKFVDNSGEMVDWLVANAPQEVVDTIEIYDFPEHQAYFTELGGTSGGFHCWEGTICFNFNAAAASFIEKAESQGAKWYWETTAKVLTTEEFEETVSKESVEADGTPVFTDVPEKRIRVTGVVAEDKDGNLVKFVGTKAVVLCCGDYGGNKVMIENLQDEMRLLYQAHGWDPANIGGMGRDGYGIKMGLWAGGAVEPTFHTQIFPVSSAPNSSYAPNITSWGGSYNGGMTWANAFVWLDSQGKRFTDEALLGAFGQVVQAERHKPGRYYCIFDNHWRTLVDRQPPEHYEEMTCAPERTLDGYGEILQQWVDAGAEGFDPGEGNTTCAWAAQSLEELLDYMGMDDGLKASVTAEIEHYNEMCEAGSDTDFGRDPNLLLPVNEPPFYGMYCAWESAGVGPVVLNGLNCDSEQRVLDADYDPIEGLYAAGNNGGGRFAVQYSTEQQGLTLGMALTHGRLLGKALAKL